MNRSRRTTPCMIRSWATAVKHRCGGRETHRSSSPNPAGGQGRCTRMSGCTAWCEAL